SPFPGMNPYLERAGIWESFHPNFISTAQFHLTAQLRPRYLVRIETRMYIHEPPAEQRYRATADLAVRPVNTHPTGSAVGTTIAPAYVTLLAAVEVQKVGFLTIRTRDGGEIVTVVELLSRANKYAGEDREQYIGKRNDLLRSRTNLVEIDLLRGGPRMPPDE